MPILRILNYFRHSDSRQAHIARTLASDSKRSFWALADQGVVSLGNFVVNLLLARYFGKHDDLASLGSFGVLMAVILFLNGIQAALIVYPLTVRGTTVGREAMGQMSGMALLLTLVGWPLLGVMVVASALVWRIDLSAGLWAAAAMLFWQAQETLRRGLLAHLRFRSALVGDSISYAGQIVVVLTLAHLGKLTVASTFAAMAITSLAAALVQAAQVRMQILPGIAATVQFARECWAMGRWVMMSSFTNLFTGMLFEWNIRFWLGAEMMGVFYAIANILRPTNPLAFAISTMIMPNATRTLREDGMHRAKRVMQRFILVGLLPLATYLGILVLAPGIGIAFFYGWDSPYHQHTIVLRIAAVASLLAYLAITVSAFLNAVERSRYTFVAQVACAAGFALIAMPLTARFGLIGAVAGWAVAAAIHVAISSWYVWRLRDEDSAVRSETAAIATPQS